MEWPRQEGGQSHAPATLPLQWQRAPGLVCTHAAQTGHPVGPLQAMKVKAGGGGQTLAADLPQWEEHASIFLSPSFHLNPPILDK